MNRSLQCARGRETVPPPAVTTRAFPSTAATNVAARLAALLRRARASAARSQQSESHTSAIKHDSAAYIVVSMAACSCSFRACFSEQHFSSACLKDRMGIGWRMYAETFRTTSKRTVLRARPSISQGVSLLLRFFCGGVVFILSTESQARSRWQSPSLMSLFLSAT